MSADNGEVPHPYGDLTDRLDALAGDGASQGAHGNRIPTGDATALEREALGTCRIELVDHMLVVAGRMPTHTVRLSDPAPQQRGGLLGPKRRERQPNHEEGPAGRKWSAQPLPPLVCAA